MKAGDKIVTDEGVELIAEHQEPGLKEHVCLMKKFVNAGRILSIKHV